MALLARKSLEEYKRGQRAGERVFIKVTYMTSALVSHAIRLIYFRMVFPSRKCFHSTERGTYTFLNNYLKGKDKRTPLCRREKSVFITCLKCFVFFLIFLERTVTCERQLMFAVETG